VVFLTTDKNVNTVNKPWKRWLWVRGQQAFVVNMNIVKFKGKFLYIGGQEGRLSKQMYSSTLSLNSALDWMSFLSVAGLKPSAVIKNLPTPV
jgi:hypothetical protein